MHSSFLQRIWPNFMAHYLIFSALYTFHIFFLDFQLFFYQSTTGQTLLVERAHDGCDRSAEDDYSSMAPGPAFAFVGGPCCPTLVFIYMFLGL